MTAKITIIHLEKCQPSGKSAIRPTFDPRLVAREFSSGCMADLPTASPCAPDCLFKRFDLESLKRSNLDDRKSRSSNEASNKTNPSEGKYINRSPIIVPTGFIKL